MKKAKILFFSILISLTGLGFLSENNFGAGFLFNSDEPTLTQTEVRNLVYADLIQPMMACYAEANPDVMMTKCAPYMQFEFRSHLGMPVKAKTKFYKTDDILGNVILNDCGAESHVCALKINYSKENKIVVQETFFKGFVSLKKYLDSFCNQIK